jgi:hypothetical protein
VTLLQERVRTEITRTPVAVRHVTEWVLGIVGALAAFVGAYMYYAPTTWFWANLTEGWFLGMFVGAGVLLAAALGVFARKAYLAHRSWTDVAMFTTGLGIIALAAAVTFAVIWII